MSGHRPATVLALDGVHRTFGKGATAVAALRDVGVAALVAAGITPKLLDPATRDRSASVYGILAAYEATFGRRGPCEMPGLVIAPAQVCPRTASGAVIDQADLRCIDTSGGIPKPLIVGDADDLALILQHRPSQEAVTTLAAGGVVVLDEAVFDGGRARLGVIAVGAQTQSAKPPAVEPRGTLDAVLEPARFSAAGVISPETARSLGILAQPQMQVVQLAAPPPPDFKARVDDRLSVPGA